MTKNKTIVTDVYVQEWSTGFSVLLTDREGEIVKEIPHSADLDQDEAWRICERERERHNLT